MNKQDAISTLDYLKAQGAPAGQIEGCRAVMNSWATAPEGIRYAHQCVDMDFLLKDGTITYSVYPAGAQFLANVYVKIKDSRSMKLLGPVSVDSVLYNYISDKIFESLDTLRKEVQEASRLLADDEQKSSVFSDSKPKTGTKKIKISITYTREVSVSDDAFSDVMGQVSQLYELQPKTLTGGFVISGTNVSIVE